MPGPWVDMLAAENQFLRAELRAGLTFSRIALRSKQESKVERNRVNARKAYEALLRFIPGTKLSEESAREINSEMAQLKADLRQLGEDV